MFSVAAISLGLLGSFHCIGMCGPIALALPLVNRNGFTRILSILFYNFGRALTYSMLGALSGLVGSGFSFFGLQQWASVLMGVLVLLFLLLPTSVGIRFKPTALIVSGLNKIKSLFSELLKRRSLPALLLIGLLNGFLPCGLVYVSIAGAIATGSWVNGAAFMFLFGLGTIPVMLSISLFSNLINLRYRRAINKGMPFVISVMAILLIIRGLNMGIPYLSPAMQEGAGAVTCCHPVKSENKGPLKAPICCKKK